MRVVSGTAGGSRLKAPKGNIVRPTSDMVKESLFNIIGGEIKSASILDLFAGSGSIGIEALSRGAENAVFVDKRISCIKIIEENLVHTKLQYKSRVIHGDAFKIIQYLSGCSFKFDIIFLDPPYYRNIIDKTLKLIGISDIISDNGIVIAERHIGDATGKKIAGFELKREKRYGDTLLSFFAPLDTKL